MKALAARVRQLFPGLFEVVRNFSYRHFSGWLGAYPRPLGNEVKAVTRVLRSSQWNMTGGRDHQQLEADFAAYIGVPHAVAVNTGGTALQMSMRALGFKPGHEVLLQVDTCSATAFAVMNAGCMPLFCDISSETFMLSAAAAEELAGPGARGLIATHMWGNPENMTAMTGLAGHRNLILIEDACLALGARANGRMAGASGKVGVFSFGCLKPIQAGEGGMIVTHDEALARELRSLRHWGDRTLDYGERDTTQLAWNGRMSEIVAAVVCEQLKGYPAYLRDLRDRMRDLQQFISRIGGLELVLGAGSSVEDCAFTQVVLRLDEAQLGCSKTALREALSAQGIGTWHANFEAIPSLTFFRDGSWRQWILAGDVERAAANYRTIFPAHQQVYDRSGLGIAKVHVASSWRLKQLKTALHAALARA